jgi:hypothetical protein
MEFNRRPSYELHLLRCNGGIESSDDSEVEEAITLSSGEDNVMYVSSGEEERDLVVRSEEGGEAAVEDAGSVEASCSSCTVGARNAQTTASAALGAAPVTTPEGVEASAVTADAKGDAAVASSRGCAESPVAGTSAKEGQLDPSISGMISAADLQLILDEVTSMKGGETNAVTADPGGDAPVVSKKECTEDPVAGTSAEEGQLGSTISGMIGTADLQLMMEDVDCMDLPDLGIYL